MNITNTECLIIAGGKENSLESFFEYGKSKAFVIACDKGYEYALKQGIQPDYVCGDFDSCSEPAPSREKIPCGVEILPTHKDDTDLIHGIKYAIGRGFEKITVTCAGGGRYDHFLSNIQALVFAKTNRPECMVCLSDDENEITVLRDESFDFCRKEGWSLSVLSFSEVSEGVTIKGAEYEVENASLSSSFPLGQSNSFKDEKVSVTVRNGVLLVIMSKL